MSKIPKTIWIYWNSGKENAPELVKVCMESWVNKNPGWDVKIIDDNSISNYLDESMLPDYLSFAHRSDVIRLLLLIKYGGVWVDSTCYCNNSLDSWLCNHVCDGFFVFSKGGNSKYNFMSNWFIASKANNKILIDLKDFIIGYWDSKLYDYDNKFVVKVKSFLGVLSRRFFLFRKLWFSFIVRDVLCIYPYFLFHYIFEVLVKTVPEHKELWKRMPKLYNDDPHIIQEYGINETIDNEMIFKIKNIPVFKLNHRVEIENNNNSLFVFLKRSV